MERILAALAKFDSRLLLGAMILIACLLAFESWVLVLAKPFAQYRQLAATRASLATILRATGNPSDELGRLAAELKQLSGRLTGALSLPRAQDQMAAALMLALDRSADRSGIMLTGVKPGTRRQVQAFEEVAFDVSARGKYLPLCAWLMNFEHTLGQDATVTEFQMRAADADRQVALTLKVALYRPLQLPLAGK